MEDHMAMTTGNLYQKVPLEDTNLTDRNVLHYPSAKGEFKTMDGYAYIKRCDGVSESIEEAEYKLRKIEPPYDELEFGNPP
jgi:hypothetical protein